MKKAEYWIEKLSLIKHPEGGWYNEVYRTKESIKKEHLHERYKSDRLHSTSIYFLITDKDFSAFHRIKSDEIWHFYEGSAITIHMIDDIGIYTVVKLGKDADKGEVFQYAIKHGVWFAGTVDEKDSFALIGCTVSPGFHFEDFELGEREKLVKMFPGNKEVIARLTKE